MIDATVARLVAEVPALQGRVAKAADLARLMERGSSPTLTPAAWVLPSGITGLPPDDATGGFVQSIVRVVSVVLVLRVHDVVGERALDELQELIEAVLDALLGWCPPDHGHEFSLRQARLTGFADGEAVYELTFTIADQKRIAP